MDSCLNCGGAILPPNVPMMYAGPVCHCPKAPGSEYQRPASKERPAPVPAPPQHPPSGTVEEKEAREKLTRRVREHFRKGELSEEMLYALEVLAEKAFNFAVDKVAEPLRQQLAEAQKAHEADAVLTGRRAMELAGEIHAAREEAQRLREALEKIAFGSVTYKIEGGFNQRNRTREEMESVARAALSQPEKPAPSGEEM